MTCLPQGVWIKYIGLILLVSQANTKQLVRIIIKIDRIHFCLFLIMNINSIFYYSSIYPFIHPSIRPSVHSTHSILPLFIIQHNPWLMVSLLLTLGDKLWLKIPVVLLGKTKMCKRGGLKFPCLYCKHNVPIQEVCTNFYCYCKMYYV